MARMPDGFVFITNVSGPKVKDGKAYADVSVEERELVMCKNCKWWDKDQTTDGINGFCPNTGCCEKPDFYCADGERRQEHGEAGEHMEVADVVNGECVGKRIKRALDSVEDDAMGF